MNRAQLIEKILADHRVADSGWPSGDELCYCGVFGDHSKHLAQAIDEALA